MVLNAFRHHGERRRAAVAAHQRHAHGVLNAFRHHGERRKDVVHARRANQYACSTPSGITASGGGKSASAYVRPWVLNAFRHHGERLTPIYAASPNALTRCSTPSGITASNGSPMIACTPARLARAQRLPASRRAAASSSSSAPRGGCHVLNAFRHHGERRDRGAFEDAEEARCSTPSGITASGGLHKVRGHITTFSGAQRLPASRRAAAITTLVQMDPDWEVCSTPSGITASGGRDARPLR